MLISLRGTHGSGKTTAVKRLLKHPYEVLGDNPEKKPDGYKVSIPGLKKPVFIVGSYKTACGGCDGIQPYALIWPRVEKYAKEGHVVFEGALVSSSYGNIGRASEPYGDDMVFAFMDTPVETCIEWIKKRREKSGKNYSKPFNPKNTISKAKNVTRSIEVITEIGRRVVMINRKKATHQILELLRKNESA
jgi:hypothetical protein